MATYISFVAFRRRAVETVDPKHNDTAAYMAFALHPDRDRIRVFDLGDATPIQEAVTDCALPSMPKPMREV